MQLRIRDQQRRAMAEAVIDEAAQIQPAEVFDLTMARLRADGTVRTEQPTGGDAA